MNRRERRATAKRLGIMEYQRKLPIAKRFELIRENIIAGKKMHEENVNKGVITREEYEAQVAAQKMYRKAMDLASRTGMSIDKAVDDVKKQEDLKIAQKEEGRKQKHLAEK